MDDYCLSKERGTKMLKINISTLMKVSSSDELSDFEKQVLLNEIQYMKTHKIKKIKLEKLDMWLIENMVQSAKIFDIDNISTGNIIRIIKVEEMK